MTPIKRYTKTTDGHKRLNLTLDPFGFIINSIAMGDVIAVAPVIKYMLDNYFVTPESHYVVAKQMFRPFFPFVSDGNWRDFDSTDQTLWGIPPGVPLAMLNKQKNASYVRNTPKSIHLTQYASLAFADQLIPQSELNYVPIEKVSVSHFGIDFSKAVILVTTYRDLTRMWYAKDILDLAAWIRSKGLTPVFVGKTNMDLNLEKTSLIPKTSLPDDVSEYGVDLRNKTTIVELASIMALAKAVCGVDSGPIHLAGTTDVPIICGYPTVAAEHRIPVRKKGKTFAITPRIECANCESHWRTSYHNFENCYFGHADCCKDFTADRYINHLKKVI
jgi:hypothetical protein